MKNDTNIIRTHSRNDPFVRVPKELANNRHMSWKARGVMLYLLGKPPSWKVRVADLENHGPTRRDGVLTALQEIRAFGYGLLSPVRETGRIVGRVFWLADAPVYFNEAANVALRKKLGLEGVPSPETDFPDTAQPEEENPPISKNEGLVRRTAGAGCGPSREARQKENKKKKNQGSAPNPVALARSAAPGGADQSSFLPVGRGRGSAPNPAGAGAPDPVGAHYPAALIQDGKRMEAISSDSPEIQADYFLYTWRFFQKKEFGRFPKLTQEDRQKTCQWIAQASPESLRSYMAMALVAWNRKIIREPNGYKRFVGCHHSRELSSFLRNMDLIEQELGWNHFDVERHNKLLGVVVKSE